MNDTNYEVPHCGAFSTPYSHPSWAYIFILYIFLIFKFLERQKLSENKHMDEPTEMRSIGRQKNKYLESLYHKVTMIHFIRLGKRGKCTVYKCLSIMKYGNVNIVINAYEVRYIFLLIP